MGNRKALHSYQFNILYGAPQVCIESLTFYLQGIKGRGGGEVGKKPLDLKISKIKYF
jgi:hypothetical protein